MSFAYYNAAYNLEVTIAKAVIQNTGKRMTSADMYSALIDFINTKFNSGQVDLQLIAGIRLAIKLSPYSGDTNQLYSLYLKAKRAHAEAKFPGIFATVNACRDKRVPIPLIISCGKYMDGALKLQAAMEPHYFGIKPIILRGDTSLTEEKFEANVLSLPIDDTYEGVPLKMMEIYTLFAALSDTCGVLKIDDDSEVKPGTRIDPTMITSLFNAADYMGISVQSALHDRIWHYGKCVQPVTFVYGKPMKAGWARGALYYLSNYALGTLARYYLRFPGVIEGEVFEDKTVGDILFDNNIRLVPCALEAPLGLDTTSPER